MYKNSVLICHNIQPGEGDETVKTYFNCDLIPNLTAWNPDLIMISCGFDAHKLDDIGKLEYSSELYGWMTRQLVKVANGKIVSTLEGGYNLQALYEASLEHVGALVE